jgi:AcrR family transcriptional regulator
MRELATKAKVNEVTVFRLFGTKQRLYAEVLQTAAERNGGSGLHSAGRSRPRIAGQKVRDLGRMLGDSSFFRLVLFGLLEKPELTMEHLHISLQTISAELSEQLRVIDIDEVSVKDRTSIALTIETLELLHQCSNKLVQDKRGRKKAAAITVAQHIRQVWLSGLANRRKTGTEN